MNKLGQLIQFEEDPPPGFTEVVLNRAQKRSARQGGSPGTPKAAPLPWVRPKKRSRK